MNVVLWLVQVALAAIYGIAGLMKTFQTQKARETLPWATDRSDRFVRFVGTAELLGAVGLILPMVTSVIPWLTVLAAFGLALIQLLAIFTEHLPKKEFKVLPMNAVLLALSIVVVFGRWVLMPGFMVS